jgi:alanine racemase
VDFYKSLLKNRSSGRPTWAEIDLDALAHNFQIIRKHVGQDAKILAAVKASAYGHGAVQCARRLEAEGADWFGVALPAEGIELRVSGISKPILCLGGFWRDEETLLLRHDLTPVIHRLDMLESLNRAAANVGAIANVHVKIDTGMGRLGVQPDRISHFCDALSRSANLRVDGLMTHLAAADDEEREEFTKQQLRRFHETVELFRSRGFQPTFIHAANSAATFAYDLSWENMVRVGGSLYGFVRDVFPANIEAPPLRPVMRLRSRIMLLKHVSKGERLGYGCTFETPRDSLIATLPVGYDDGYRRALSNRGRVIVKGQFAAVVGRVSMDLTLIDVTDVPAVSLDDEVTLLGTDGQLTITAEDIAEAIGTISYEVTCGISSRVPRVFSQSSLEGPNENAAQ